MKVHIIQNIEAFTVQDFAKAVGRSVSTVNSWIAHGNRFRKIHIVRDEKRKPYIPVIELWHFPITFGGRGGDVYHMAKALNGGLMYVKASVYCGAERHITCQEDCEKCLYNREVVNADSNNVSKGFEN